MLSGMPQTCMNAAPMPKIDSTWDRNFKDDMHTALDLFYKFKEGLDKLHPECARNIERLLQIRF